MEKEKKKMGRPSLGEKAKRYFLRLRLTADDGRELEIQAKLSRVRISELARADIRKGIKERRKDILGSE